VLEGLVMTGLFRVVAVVALLAAGCAGEQNTSAPGRPVPPTGSSGGSVPSTTGATPTSSGSAVPTTGPISGPPLNTTTTDAPAPAPGGACVAPGSVRITAGVVPEPVCLPVNGSLRLTSDPSPHQPWGPLVSSNPKILSCTSETSAQGTVSGVCTPHLPGTVTVSAMTAPFAGDLHGPPQFRWELRINVVAYGVN
jgi:hypothetical protein